MAQTLCVKAILRAAFGLKSSQRQRFEVMHKKQMFFFLWQPFLVDMFTPQQLLFLSFLVEGAHTQKGCPFFPINCTDGLVQEGRGWSPLLNGRRWD
jgi:hypothetical protein